MLRGKMEHCPYNCPLNLGKASLRNLILLLRPCSQFILCMSINLWTSNKKLGVHWHAIESILLKKKKKSLSNHFFLVIVYHTTVEMKLIYLKISLIGIQIAPLYQPMPKYCRLRLFWKKTKTRGEGEWGTILKVLTLHTLLALLWRVKNHSEMHSCDSILAVPGVNFSSLQTRYSHPSKGKIKLVDAAEKPVGMTALRTS